VRRFVPFAKFLLVPLVAFALAGCEYEEIEREIGYKGPARVDPWLAAERFLERCGRPVRVQRHWQEPQPGDAMWVMPVEVLANEAFVRTTERWVERGGHLLCLVEHASAGRGDWGIGALFDSLRIEPPAKDFLGRAGLELGRATDGDATAQKLDVRGKSFEVDVRSGWQVTPRDGKPVAFASVKYGKGRISVLADARPLRNRWIGDKQHAGFLLELAGPPAPESTVVFLRGHTLSLASLLAEKASPFLIGLAVVVVFWLWKNLARFGPLEAADAPAALRGYDRHLEALGDFHWRLDRGAGLLAPLRGEILDRCHHLAARTGRPGADGYELLAERSGLPRERVARALGGELPTDSAAFTRLVADLQHLLATLS
jgi:hypothetical protein